MNNFVDTEERIQFNTDAKIVGLLGKVASVM